MTIFFTSDTHFGHTNIIKYCNRPFKSVEEMDETIINNWNSVVKDEDDIYHLGDFCLGDMFDFEKYANRLNGTMFILENEEHHDKKWISQKSYWDGYPPKTLSGENVHFLYPIYNLELKEKKYQYQGHNRTIVLCHFPIYYWELKHYLSWHLYGHIHNEKFNIPTSPLSCNVGVDLWDFTPVSLERIAEVFLDIQKKLNLKAINEE